IPAIWQATHVLCGGAKIGLRDGQEAVVTAPAGLRGNGSRASHESMRIHYGLSVGNSEAKVPVFGVTSRLHSLTPGLGVARHPQWSVLSRIKTIKVTSGRQHC